MKERDLEKACMNRLRQDLSPMPLLWKIRDETTGGQPDLEVVWNGHTTKIEFKRQKKGEQLHAKWEDARQLVTCVQYEKASGGRCWVVVYRTIEVKGAKFEHTLIYRPSRLLGGNVPQAARADTFDKLWNNGAIFVDGFDEGHRLVAQLIRETHQ